MIPMKESCQGKNVVSQMHNKTAHKYFLHAFQFHNRHQHVPIFFLLTAKNMVSINSQYLTR